jgi:DNA-binding CsgD family transcriptional regulator
MVLTLSHRIPFVGREDSLGPLRAAWDEAVGGARTVVLVLGEAGSGKSRLATEFARQVHDDGGAVLYGACAEGDPSPYGPFREAFEALARDLSPEGRRALTTGSGRWLRRLSEAFAVDVPAIEGGDAERFAVGAAVSDSLDALSAHRPLLVVLDDLHWASAETADLLDDLCRGATPRRTCVVATFRTEPGDLSDAARAVAADLRRRPGTSTVRLRGLDRPGIGAFVEAAAGHRLHLGLASVLAFLEEQTGGNPFFLGELWAHLVETGRLVRPDQRWRLDGPIDGTAAPESVLELVSARLGRLPVEAAELLEWAAVIGPNVEVEVLAAAAGRSLADTMAALEAAERANLVEEVGPGLLRFTHSLVQRGAYDCQAPGGRRLRHLGVAEALGRLPGPPADGAIAHHLLEALPLGDRDAAVAAARRAAARAAAAARHAEAAASLRAALPALGDTGVRAQVLLDLAEASMRAGDVLAAQEMALAAHELAVALHLPDLVVESAIAHDEANWRAAVGGAASQRVLEAALGYASTPAAEARLHAALGRVAALGGRSGESRSIAEAAMRLARDAGDAEAIRTAYTALLLADWSPGAVGEQLAIAREFSEFAIAAGNREWELWAIDKLMYATVWAGRLDETRAIARRHRTLAEEIDQPLFRVLDLQVRALLATGEGRFLDAERAAAEANELGRYLSGQDASGGHGVQLFSLRREQGRLEEARPFLGGVVQGTVWRPALAVLYAELGMLDEARAELHAVVADGLASVPDDSMRGAALWYLAETAVMLADVPAAEAVHGALAPYGGLVVQAGSFLAAYGAADRLLGGLAALLGRPRDAEARFEAALRLETAARMPVWVARTQLAYGRFLVGRTDGDPGRAVTLLQFAADGAATLGMAGVAADAARELAGARDRTRAPRGPGIGLTARELEVLRLLVVGQTNQRIGETLHISRHTAANHVRAILLKAGCANRTEAASWAVRNGVI